MVQINNVFERAISLLVNQFREQNLDGSLTNLQKLVKIITEPVQNIEDVNWELKTERWLSTAVGVQLDELGVILGLPRELNESDEDYRERLQFQIFINISNGTPEDSIRVLKFLTKASYIGYFELYPAAYQMETNGLVFPNPYNDLNDAIFQVSPAGVNYAPIVLTYNVPISFELSPDFSFEPLFLAPDPDNFEDLVNLEVNRTPPPTTGILYVSSSTIIGDNPNGGLDELNFPLPNAGQLSELVQKGGNFPPRRFE